MTEQALLQEIGSLPPQYWGEVADFVGYLKQKNLKQPLKTESNTSQGFVHIPETMLLSEAALAKDWNTQEEDEAWKDL
ncbi:hypothetical protein FACS1894137_05570 [Spirochaetia bacterium]|nr:hypothetical protein FACS1894137_05570 [Spirochaetia bacterium]